MKDGWLEMVELLTGIKNNNNNKKKPFDASLEK